MAEDKHMLDQSGQRTYFSLESAPSAPPIPGGDEFKMAMQPPISTQLLHANERELIAKGVLQGGYPTPGGDAASQHARAETESRQQAAPKYEPRPSGSSSASRYEHTVRNDAHGPKRICGKILPGRMLMLVLLIRMVVDIICVCLIGAALKQAIVGPAVASLVLLGAISLSRIFVDIAYIFNLRMRDSHTEQADRWTPARFVIPIRLTACVLLFSLAQAVCIWVTGVVAVEALVAHFPDASASENAFYFLQLALKADSYVAIAAALHVPCDIIIAGLVLYDHILTRYVAAYHLAVSSRPPSYSAY